MATKPPIKYLFLQRPRRRAYAPPCSFLLPCLRAVAPLHPGKRSYERPLRKPNMGRSKGKNRGSGGGRKPNARSKLKKYKRACWLKNRAMDTDQIQDEIEKAAAPGAKPVDAFEYDDELPGGGQFFCIETMKHFADAKGLADHKKSRYYKRRCKDLKEEKYTQEEAERASGMTKEKLPPAHPK